MTRADAMAIVREFDAASARYLAALEPRIRADLAATRPEDQDALDRPRDPDAPWSRLTVEEILEGVAVHLAAWRTEMVAIADRVE